MSSFTLNFDEIRANFFVNFSLNHDRDTSVFCLFSRHSHVCVFRGGGYLSQVSEARGSASHTKLCWHCDDSLQFQSWGFFIIIIIINSLAFMHDPVIWIKIQKEILTKMIGEWSQTTVVAARLLPGMEPYSRCCPDFIFVESWKQPMILEWNKGWLFFHKQLPSRFIFKNRRIKIVMVFATLNIEVHSNWD